MQSISVGDFKADFSEILKQIQNSGEKYIIQYGKKQTKVAIIVPYDDALVEAEKREFGIYKGKGSFYMHDDFAMSEEGVVALMKYIIDTHIFLWLLFDPQKIDKTKLEVLKNPENSIYITSINFWEISLKFGLGKLELKGLKPENLPDCALQMGIKILEIDSKTWQVFISCKRVDKHKDPFDRLIIWHCINNNFVLVSKDGKFSEYSSIGLKVI